MSLRIDISNYEAYVVDYLEGALSEDVLAAFEAFLLSHPELALEIEDMQDDPVALIAVEEPMNAESVKLNVVPLAGIDEGNYEEVFALADEEDIDQIESFVAVNPFLEKDFKLYNAARLKPSADVVFEGIRDLKKPVPLWEQVPRTALRAAAAVILIFGWVSVWNSIDRVNYAPRSGELEFAELGNTPDVESADTEPKVEIAEVNVTTESRRRENIALMPMMKLQRENRIAPKLSDRNDEWVAVIEDLEPSHKIGEPRIVGDRTAELTVAQYLGKQFLGVDPGQAPTTKDVLKQGAKKVIDNSEQVALNTSVTDDHRKTVEFMAGLFEFKRVTYAAN